MTFWLLSGENAKLNPNNIQTVSLVTSLTINLLTIVNVLRLSSAILKHTKTHSSPGLSSTWTIWTTILCAQIQLTASGKPSIIGTSYFIPALSRCINAERPCNVYIQIRIQIHIHQVMHHLAASNDTLLFSQKLLIWAKLSVTKFEVTYATCTLW